MNDDRDLRRLFADLRREDRNGRPSVEGLLRGRRRRLRLLAAALGAAAAAALAAALWNPRPAPQPSIAEWRSPTTSLLVSAAPINPAAFTIETNEEVFSCPSCF